MPKNPTEESGFSHILLLLIGLLILSIIGVKALANIKTSKDFPTNNSSVQGVLIAKGGDDSSPGSSGSGSSGSGSSGSSGSSDTSSNSGPSGSSFSDPSESNNPSSTPTPNTTRTEFRPKASASSSPTSSLRVRTKQSNDRERTEVKFSEDEKIKTRVENDRTRIDVYSGGIKVRYEIRDGRVIIKAENEAGEEVGQPEQEIFKIEDRLSEGGIKVATEGGKLVITRNDVGAVSSFPLQIDLNTNQLIASTSAGVKVLATLPDQAVQNLLAANIISKLNPLGIASQANLGNITSVKDVISLGERDGAPVYEVNGIKEQRLLGFIPVTTQTTVFVSAETGQPVAQEQSLLANIIDLLSP